MSEYFLEITNGGPCKHFGGTDLGCYGTVRNKNSHNESNEKGSGESDRTSTAILLSTSLASCDLKNGFRRSVSHIICINSKFSTSEKRMLIVIHFDPSRSFFYRDLLLAI